MERKCLCGETDLSKFSKKKNKPQYTCKECHKIYRKKHYEENKAKYIAKACVYRQKVRDRISDLKSKPCADCKVQYPSYVMQFDHISGKKIATISKMAGEVSIKKLYDEIEKCEIVCANCHAERTHKRIIERKK